MMMSYTLFLDDERMPVDPEAIICRTFKEAVDTVTFCGVPDHVDFDHDLGEEMTGHNFAIWLTNHSLDGNSFPASYAVHSQNPIGAENIRNTMDAYYRHINGETA